MLRRGGPSRSGRLSTKLLSIVDHIAVQCQRVLRAADAPPAIGHQATSARAPVSTAPVTVHPWTGPGTTPRGGRGDQATAGRDRGTVAVQVAAEGGVGFLHGRVRPAVQALVAFIDAFKQVLVVEPICRVLSAHGRKTRPGSAGTPRTRSARLTHSAPDGSRVPTWSASPCRRPKSPRGIGQEGTAAQRPRPRRRPVTVTRDPEGARL